MADSQENALMEEREELMVSPVDDEVKPIFRLAHFLKPTIPSAQKFPFLTSRPNLQELKISSCYSSLKVKFRGGVMHMKGWSKWVDKLKPLYQDTWKKAGIFEAITGSTFKIYMHHDLIYALAERWCLQTNTFILPWGEATVTLEDMVVLGGFSVLGHSVFNPLKTKESDEIVKTLTECYNVIRKYKVNVYHHAWMEYFAGKGGDHLEHVAFLTLWLSKYVFPSKGYQKVQPALIPMAIHLSQGNSMALAPAVLATIYRDLNLLKQLIVSSSKQTEQSNTFRCIEDESDLILRAPLHFVQLWAWERFPNLQPKSSIVINSGEPRVARWHKVKKLNCVDPRSEIDSASECFLWRPYAIDTVKNWDINKFYKEREEYVMVEQQMGSEILIFARLIRASELVGMDCVELYNPHRVSMQFGFDQDVPGCVNPTWRNYDRPIQDAKLYIPSRLIESDVSSRYLEWWKNQNIKFLQKCDEVRKDGSSFQDCEMRVVESSDDDDNIPILESLRRMKLMKKEITVPANQEPLSST
ncbi:serine/threonine-protein phosphatase 7 long form homolog [Lycium ferocissimum]|uniref:serine/threonine-protein phosphatase 7 long form homolog n=1 Tax=Lycium ferocissimum TaxID=112874 RepID=UPI0028152296|nr:serine/threonine-protein phosphatase 7 long form homolog [Lycium ferocissimum]